MRTCPSKRIGCLAGRLHEALGDEPEAPSPSGIQTPCDIQTPCGMQTPCLIQTPVNDGFAPFSWQSREAIMQTSDMFVPDPFPQSMGMQSMEARYPPATMLGTGAVLPSVTDLRLADLLEVDGPPAVARTVSVSSSTAESAMVGQPVYWQAQPSLDSAPWFAATQSAWHSAPLVPPSPVVPPPPPGPALGSSELPSIGSATHSKGSCRPCAFLHTKGCENGLACTFCHLCEPGERKRRQKEKLQQRRAAQQARQAAKAERAA